MKPPSILHISNDFTYQHLYNQLVLHNSNHGMVQHIFSPIRLNANGNWQYPKIRGAKFYIERIIAPLHRIFFRRKISVIKSSIESKIDLERIDITHAHTLYSDGAVALRLKRSHGIPYIVAFRNTDLNAFMKYRPDLKLIRNDVIKEAEKIIFLSPAYRDKLCRQVSPFVREIIDKKGVVIPNGVREGWLTNSPKDMTISFNKKIRILYVGDMSKNKNLLNLLASISILSSSRSVHLTVVGGSEIDADNNGLLNALGRDMTTFLGRIEEESELRDVYREHDIFVMPSYTETFGIVYIEALSQGLPIVHSNGHGVHGLFKENTVSENVDPYDPNDIACAISTLIERLCLDKSIPLLCISEAKRFNWKDISKKYVEIYSSILR
ncbi:glycosyltransferase [Luminiphilus sp.]|nr:glycosyltransferase [Luminiphilus sp.]MDB2313493.1 glycosyltransferase [Luminiphilus sp.]